MKKCWKQNKQLILLLVFLLLAVLYTWQNLVWDTEVGEGLPIGAHLCWRFIPFAAFTMLLGAGAIVWVWKSRKGLALDWLIPLFVVLFGSLVAFASPVMNGYDETAHFFKTVATLDGKTFDYSSYNYEISDSYLLLCQKIGENCFSAPLQAPWAETRTYVEALTTGFAQPTYPSYGYLFAALGLGIGQLLHLGAGLCFLLGRLTNLLGFALLTFFAFRLIPQKFKTMKLALSLAALFPGTLFIAAHYTQDGIFYGIVFLMIALYLKMQAGEPHFTRWFALFAILLLLITPLKYPYMILGFLLFLIPKEKYPFKRSRLWTVGLAAVTVAFAAVWFLFVSSQFTENRVPNVNSMGQLRYMIQHPLTAAKNIIMTFVVQIYPYFAAGFTASGTLWYHISVTWRTICLFIVVFSVIRVSQDIHPSAKRKGWYALILFGIYVITAVALYASFNPVGHSGLIEGIQGRYFFPLLFFLPLIVPEKWKRKTGGEAIVRIAEKNADDSGFSRGCISLIFIMITTYVVQCGIFL